MENNAKIQKVNPPKKPAAMREEMKRGVDARDLIGRFRSKADIYEYLSEHRKSLSTLTFFDSASVMPLHFILKTPDLPSTVIMTDTPF